MPRGGYSLYENIEGHPAYVVMVRCCRDTQCTPYRPWQTGGGTNQFALDGRTCSVSRGEGHSKGTDRGVVEGLELEEDAVGLLNLAHRDAGADLHKDWGGGLHARG